MASSPTPRLASVLLVVLALLAGLSFFESPGTGDMDLWKAWTETSSIHGPVRGFRENLADYPPLATVILWTGSRSLQRFVPSTFIAIKCSILVFLLLTTGLFWLWTRSLKLTLALYLALLLNSMALGYIDVFFAPSLIASLWMLKARRHLWFAVFYSLACLTKWQPTLIGPFLAIYLARSGGPRGRVVHLRQMVLQVVLPASALLGACLAIFGLDPVWKAFQASMRNPYLSGNALNLNWIVTHALHVLAPQEFGPLQQGMAEHLAADSSPITVVPRLLFVLTYLLLLFAFARRERTFLELNLFASSGVVAYFTLSPGVHENHLFLVTLLAVVIHWLDPARWVSAWIVILLSNINLFVFYGVDGTLRYNRTVLGVDVALPLALLEVSFASYLILGTLASGGGPRRGPDPGLASQTGRHQENTAPRAGAGG